MSSRGNAWRYNRPKASAYTPLRIRAYLRTGIVGDSTIPIDAVLYYAEHRHVLGAQMMTVPGGENMPNTYSGCVLPIMRVNEDGPLWYYAASFAQWPEATTEGKDHWNARIDTAYLDLVDFGKRKARIDVGAGEFKSYHMPIFYRHAEHINWYVRGLKSVIEDRLTHMTHLGKKTSQGWGRVACWEVSDWPEDWSVRGPEGRLMRAIPASSGAYSGYRPSYWLPKNQSLCEMPNL